MVVLCFVSWCVLVCGAACVPWLDCVWRALLARACCCEGAGTHSLSGGSVWLRGGTCWRPAVARCTAVGCVFWGGGGWLFSERLPSPCPAVPFCRPAVHAHPFCTHWGGLSWLVGLGCLTWCFSSAGRHGLGLFWGVGCAVVCLFGGPRRVYGVLGLPAPVHRCARSLCCVACAVSWTTWLLFTGVHARCAVLRVRCPAPLGSCPPVRTPDVLCCVCGVRGPLALVYPCARVACVVFFFFLGMAVPRPRLHKSAQLRGSSKDSRYLQQNREVSRHKVSMTLSKKKP